MSVDGLQIGLNKIHFKTVFNPFICLKVDMVEIKTTYQQEYKETLMDEIMIRYEDEQKNLLMALIKGRNFPLTNHFT